MTHESEAGLLDHDLINDGDPGSTVRPEPRKTKLGKVPPKLLEFEGTMPPPADPNNPGEDVLDRSLRYDSEFTAAIQRNLGRICGHPGKVVDWRSMKYWNDSLRGPGDATPPLDPKQDKLWREIMAHNSVFFDLEGADEDDFIVLVQDPTGDISPIHIRRVAKRSLRG